MRYLVKARLKPGMGPALLRALADGSLGRGSIAGDEYRHDLEQARLAADGTAQWVEVCFCATPLEEERPHWELFFELLSVKDAHARSNCRHENGTAPWACCDCDCTAKLEQKLQTTGRPFLPAPHRPRSRIAAASMPSLKPRRLVPHLAKTEGGRLLQYFLRGLIVLVPIALTVSILYWVFDRVDGILRPFVSTRGMGLVLILTFIVAVGWVSSFFLIKRLYRLIDGWLEHTPVVNFIYSSLRDFLEAFAGKKRRFTHSVLVNVLAEEVWLVGFLTDEDLDGFKLGEKYVSVYVPQAYNVAGQLYLVKRDRVRPIEHLSSPDVMKYAVSGGAVELVIGTKPKPAPLEDAPVPVA